jgi:hypothetical protein
MFPCPCCDVNQFKNSVDREMHVERCARALRKKYLELLESLKTKTAEVQK